VAFFLIVSTVSDLVHSFYKDLWNKWDDGRVDEVLAPDFEFRGSLGTSTAGRDGWRSYRDTIRAGAADFHNTVLALVCEGSSAAARLHYSGTHTGPMLGIEATGRRFEYAGAAFFTVSDGLLSSAWVLGDLDSLRAQLAGSRSGADA
jgi:predicted ester cyclase